MLPPEIGCPRCGFQFKTSSVFCALPALTRCPTCGLSVAELRASLTAPGPRPQLEPELHRLERVSHGAAASLETQTQALESDRVEQLHARHAA